MAATLWDAPGGAENTICNTDKEQLCLMLGMFRRRAGTHGTLSRKMSVATWWRVFFLCCGRLVNWDRHNRGLAKHRTRMCFRVGVDPGCQCFVRSEEVALKKTLFAQCVFGPSASR